MFPALNVTEADETVITESYNGLPARNLFGDVLGCAAGYACAALKGRFIDEGDNLLGILGMLFFGEYHLYLIIVHLTVENNY